MSDLFQYLWQKPTHHEDLEHKNHHVHWIELFYDLVHVVCVFLLGGYLSHHLNLQGFLIFSALFAMIWIAWGDTVFYTSLYVSNDAIHRVIMAFQICTVMVFAAAINNIPGKGEFFFAIGYAANRTLLAFMYWRAIRHNIDEQQSLAREMFRLFFGLAIIFLISAFLPNPFNYWLWFAGILLLQLGYLLPKYGVMRYKRFTPRIDHLSERFALLMLIVIGEGFFKMVVGLSEKGIYKISPEIFFNYVLGGLMLCAMCWIYFDFIGNGKIKTTKKDMSRWWYSHLVMMMAAVMMGVALAGEVKVGFFESYPTKYGLIGCGGLILFLSCSWLIQISIDERYEHRLYGLGLRLFGITMALVTFALLGKVPAFIGNTLFTIALLSQIVIPLFRTRNHSRFHNENN